MKKRYSVRVEEEDLTAMKKEAKKQSRPVAWVVREAWTNYLASMRLRRKV